MIQSKIDMKTAHLATQKIRLWNPTTRQYLHLSGESEVRSADWSWSGFKHQAETLERRAKARGEDWPYVQEDAGLDAKSFDMWKVA